MGSELVGNPLAGFVISVVAGPIFYLLMGLFMIVAALVIILVFYEEPLEVEDGIK